MKGKPVVEELLSAIGKLYCDVSPELWASYQSSIGKLNRLDMGVILNHAVEKHEFLKPTPLKRARYGDSRKTLYDLIESLLAHGADPNQEVDGEFPLKKTGDRKVMRLLLVHGADPNKATDSSNPALMNFWLGPEEIRLLLNAGADPKVRNDGERTALKAAGNNPKCLKLLLNAGADPNQRDAEGKTVIMYEYLSSEALKVLLEGGADPNARDKQGRTPLMFMKDAASVQALKARGADFTAQDQEGRTVLMHALSLSFQESKTITAMIKAGTPVNAVDQNGNCALRFEPNGETESLLGRSFSFDESDTNFLNLLLKSGADPNLPNKKGETPLMYWAGNSQNKECRKVVDLLLKSGADIHRTDNQGLDALMHAAKNRNQRVIKLLLSKKADPARTSKNGRTCIEWAVAGRTLPERQLVDSLLDGSANINGNPKSRKNKLNVLGKFLLGSDLPYCMTLLKCGARVNHAMLNTMGVSLEDLGERAAHASERADPESPIERLLAFSRLDPAIFIESIDNEDPELAAMLKQLTQQKSMGNNCASDPLAMLEPVNWPFYVPKRQRFIVEGVTVRHTEPYLDFTEEESRVYAAEGTYRHKTIRSNEGIIELITNNVKTKKLIGFTDLIIASDETLVDLWNGVVSKNWKLVHLPGGIYGMTKTSGRRISAPQLKYILARCGVDVIPGMLIVARDNPNMMCRVLVPVSDSKIAPLMASRLIHTPVSRMARNWFSRHPVAAIEGLIPLAVGSLTDARSDCEAALRFLACRGFARDIQRSAVQYGKNVRKSLDEILSIDPRLDYHRKPLVEIPEALFGNEICRPVVSSTGDALPDRCLPALYGRMSLSAYDDVYPDLLEIRHLFEPESLADFAWSVFQFWDGLSSSSWASDEGKTKKSTDWAFHGLAYLGNDKTVKSLAPRIRTWPKEGGMSRAVTGLDILANIGSDTAIRTINAILLKTKYKPLLERAGEIMETIAEVRGLTKDQLGDRLVPTLGLDDNGTMTLDFGPRAFSVRLNERLKPSLVDNTDKTIKALPRAAKGDDKQRAAEATARWKELKADLRAEAPTQLLRLELAMIEERRWTGADFKTLLAGHPLLRHVVSSLVWAEYEGKKLKKAFRVDKDGTFFTNRDEPYELDDTAIVGIPHPLAMKSQLREWGECLARHKVRQAFPQIGRQYFVRKDDRDGDLFGVQGGKAPTKVFRGMKAKGWKPLQEGIIDYISEFEKQLSSGVARLRLDNWVTIYDHGNDDEEQTMSVSLPKKLTPIEYSEIVRELMELLH